MTTAHTMASLMSMVMVVLSASTLAHAASLGSLHAAEKRQAQGGTPGFRTVASSGVAVQMVFLPPMSNKAVFVDNYHVNQGGPGYDWRTNTYGSNWMYPKSNTNVFGAELDLSTMAIRALHPQTNTFCSAGAFFPNGTLLNMGGAEPNAPEKVYDGLQSLRTYAPGPCTGSNGACTQDWVESGGKKMVRKRWYPTAQTLTDGSIIMVGGSHVGGLFANCAQINEANYERHYPDGRAPSMVDLSILQFAAEDNQNPLKAWNLYPLLHLLPNAQGSNLVFQMAAIQAEVWNYDTNRQQFALPGAPNNQPRTFPSSSTSVMLPLRLLPNGQSAEPTILLCGGSSSDVPNPKGLNDCWTNQPLSKTSTAWVQDDDLPLGPQTMSDGVLLPDGKVLLLNGARIGAAGGFMAEDPVLEPVMYTPWLPKGQRWIRLNQKSSISRMYHSVATLLPSGEVLIAGSNTIVTFGRDGRNCCANIPVWSWDGKPYLLQQQTGNYPTEYRVEIYSPPYINSSPRPILSRVATSVKAGQTFTATLNRNGLPANAKIEAMLSNPGFVTHSLSRGQRMIEMVVVSERNGVLTIRAPPNYSYAPPGYYLLFVNVMGFPSEGKWIQIK